MQRRTFKYRLYPSREQSVALSRQPSEARSLYNAAVQERRDAWQMQGVSRNYYDQANQIKEIRDAGNLGLANFSACQDVLRRVDKTFKSFFRRIKAGEKAVIPASSLGTDLTATRFLYGETAANSPMPDGSRRRVAPNAAENAGAVPLLPSSKPIPSQ